MSTAVPGARGVLADTTDTLLPLIPAEAVKGHTHN